MAHDQTDRRNVEKRMAQVGVYRPVEIDAVMELISAERERIESQRTTRDAHLGPSTTIAAGCEVRTLIVAATLPNPWSNAPPPPPDRDHYLGGVPLRICTAITPCCTRRREYDGFGSDGPHRTFKDGTRNNCNCTCHD